MSAKDKDRDRAAAADFAGVLMEFNPEGVAEWKRRLGSQEPGVDVNKVWRDMHSEDGGAICNDAVCFALEERKVGAALWIDIWDALGGRLG